MIKNSNIIDTNIAAPANWGDFKIEDLFDVHLSMGDNKLADLPRGDIPLITAGETNNGIAGFIKTGDGRAQTFPANTLTADMFCNIFYQPTEYYAVSHGRINMMIPKFKEMNKRHLTFIAAITKVQTIGRYGFDRMLSSAKLKNLTITLPIDNEGNPDCVWMSSYVKELEERYKKELEERYKKELEERYKKELEERYKKELEAYLQVTGLSDTTLTDEEQTVLEQWNAYMQGMPTVTTKEFKIGHLFMINSTNSINYLDLKPNGKHPYVVRSTKNNGIREFMDYDNKFLNRANVITFGVDTSTYFYQPQKFFTGTNIKTLRLKTTTLTEKLGMFFVTLLQKQATGYGYVGGKSFSVQKLADSTLTLPVTPDNQPDYHFMETYISAQQKLAIDRLSAFRQKEIDTTEELIQKDPD